MLLGRYPICISDDTDLFFGLYGTESSRILGKYRLMENKNFRARDERISVQGKQLDRVSQARKSQQ